MDNFSLADIKAVTDDNDGGWGNGGAWWIIVLFLFMFGNGGFWGNRGTVEQPVTEGSLCNAMNFNNLENAVGRLSDNENLHMMQISQGLATTGYENLRNFADTQSAIKDGDYALAAQLAQCCCDNKQAIADVKFTNEKNTAEINANTTAQIQKVLDTITTNRMAEMQNQINQLQLQSAMCGVVRYPNATTYNAGCNPYFNGNCGCAAGTTF
ncbi:MAG: hypothetical protein EGR23_06365 [Holdemanella biformis]|nr:hypothetical protein [Holdemanella biformis]